MDELITVVVDQEWPVSLRGVFYRVVSAGGIEKTENAYKTIGRRLLELRRTGRVSYERITDGTRWVIAPTTFTGIEAALRDTARVYRRALWRDQHVQVFVFCEKDAISGVLAPITDEWDVPLGVLRGYCSESFAYSMAQAIQAALDTDHACYVYGLGDHDPSGVDAWRAFEQRVSGFLTDLWGRVAFQRLAVTPEQIEEWGLPTRPTKPTDTRAAKFHGESVEVDAIPAPDLRDVLEEAILEHMDPYALEVTRRVEQAERQALRHLAAEYHPDADTTPDDHHGDRTTGDS